MPRAYTVVHSATVSTAITVLEVTAPSTMVLQIVRAWVSQESSTTSAQTAIILQRKTATITGTAITPSPLEKSGAAATATAKRTATVEGTNGDTIYRDGLNILNGWTYIPTPPEYCIVQPSGMIAITFAAAPASATYEYGITFVELG